MIFLSMLFQNYGQAFDDCIPECEEEIENVCAYMEQYLGIAICGAKKKVNKLTGSMGLLR